MKKNNYQKGKKANQRRKKFTSAILDQLPDPTSFYLQFPNSFCSLRARAMPNKADEQCQVPQTDEQCKLPTTKSTSHHSSLIQFNNRISHFLRTIFYQKFFCSQHQNTAKYKD